MAALPAGKAPACAYLLLFFGFKTSSSFFSCYSISKSFCTWFGFGICTREIKFHSIFFAVAVVERFLCSDSVSQFGPFCLIQNIGRPLWVYSFSKESPWSSRMRCSPFVFPKDICGSPPLSSNTLSPTLVVFLYPRTSQQLSGYLGIFAVSLLEKVFWRQSVFLYFLRYSACAFPLVCPFLWSLCSATRPSTVPWWAVSFFLPRTLYARHPEASRIATHEALPSVESSRCVSISGFTYSHDGVFRHIHSMRSVGGRTLQGLEQLCVSCTAFGLLPWLCRRLVPSTRVWRKRIPLPAWPRSLS